MEYISDEIALISSLQFAPIDPIPLRSRSQHTLHSSTPDHRVKLLQSRLQTLVAAHQAAILDNVGDINVVRNEIQSTLELLRETLSEIIDSDRFEVIKAIGQREDANRRQAEIDRLTSPAETDAAEFDQEKAEVAQIDRQMKELKNELTRLQSRRLELGKSLRQRQTARLKHNEQHQVELKRLRSLPTRQDLTESIDQLQSKIRQYEKEAVALDEGGSLLQLVMQELVRVEEHVKETLREKPVDNTKLLSLFTETIGRLEDWLNQVKAKEWKLLEVVLEAEVEGYRIAKTMVEQQVEDKTKSAKTE